VRSLFRPLLHLGLLGLVMLGVADSSFLVLPFGNDLLLVILVAADHGKVAEYVPTAAFGSMLGVMLVDVICRKRGEPGLMHMMSQKRFKFLKDKVGGRAAVAIAIACLAPPPFPFTPVIAAASAFQYPRPKLLGMVFASRLVRYSLVAWAAIHWGTQIVRVARSKEFVWSMIGFTVVCAILSTISVMKWMRSSRPAEKSARSSRPPKKS
jgi:membrane protein YqaA with SNARE-associated domain